MVLQFLCPFKLGDCDEIAMIIPKNPYVWKVILPISQDLDCLQVKLLIFKHPENSRRVENFLIENVFGLKILKDFILLAQF